MGGEVVADKQQYGLTSIGYTVYLLTTSYFVLGQASLQTRITIHRHAPAPKKLERPDATKRHS